MANRKDSASEILRSLVKKEAYVKKKQQKGKINAAQEMLKTTREIKRLSLSKAPGDLSVNHDHYLYGWPKKQ
jgi:predicted metal-dependent enzyme (double-stranded beta helix superfamily)